MQNLILSPGALRLALASTVLVYHYMNRWGAPLYWPIGGFAVYGFFFLSGYWVARLWDNKYSKCQYPLWTFYLSRAWRIYPLATLATLLMFELGRGTWSDLVRDIPILGKHLIDGMINPINWTIALELQFYLIAPLLFVLVRYKSMAWLLLLIGFVFWMIFGYEPKHVLVIYFLFLFVLGILYAKHPLHNLAIRAAPYSLAVVLLLGLGTSIPAVRVHLPEPGWTIHYLAIFLGIVGLPYVAASLSKISTASDRALGELAYPVYLFHIAGYVIAVGLSPDNHLLIAVAMTTLLVFTVHVLIDRPLERLRHRFVDRRMDRQIDDAKYHQSQIRAAQL